MRLLILLMLVNSIPAFGQEGINEFLIYHNENEKVHYYHLLNDEMRLVNPSQEKTEAPLLKIVDKQNLILDTIPYPVYYHDFLMLSPNELMITSFNTSYLFKFDESGKINRDEIGIVREFENKSSESVLLGEHILSWQNYRGGRKYINLQLKLDSERTLISDIPKKFKNNKDNPTGKQRYLNLKQNFVNDQLVCFLFRAQRLYFIDRESFEVTYFDLPEFDDAVWYYFGDHIKGRNYLVKEYADQSLALYGFYKNSGIQKLYDLDYFPQSILDESIILKEKEDDGFYHYKIPFQKLKPLNAAAQLIPLEEIVVKSN